MSQKILKAVLVIAAICAFGYVFYSFFGSEWWQIYDKYFPCQRPIVYSLGSFDTRFGLSKKDLLQTLQEAETIWEKPISRNLFEYKADAASDGGVLRVNLIYDYRQEATAKIQNLGLAVSDTRASYDALKVKYDALQQVYLQEKKDYQAKITSFQSEQNAYNQKVAYWNKKGGAPKDVYDELQREAAALKTELDAIHKLENDINAQAANINALVVVINKLAATLNLNAVELNTIGKERGEEFTEGEYKSDVSGQEIDIYEFSTKDKLRRVLAHELGHALGLDHVADPKAIMYRLNEGAGGTLTKDDLTALKTHCQIK